MVTHKYATVMGRRVVQGTRYLPVRVTSDIVNDICSMVIFLPNF